MKITAGSIVRSMAGHDKGSFFVVLKTDNEFVYLSDGETRKTESPKRKKLKHIQGSNIISGSILKKLEKGEKIENFEVRKALAELGGYNIG